MDERWSNETCAWLVVGLVVCGNRSELMAERTVMDMERLLLYHYLFLPWFLLRPARGVGGESAASFAIRSQ